MPCLFPSLHRIINKRKIKYCLIEPLALSPLLVCLLFSPTQGGDQTKLNQKSRSTIIKQKSKTLKEKDFVFVVHPFLFFFYYYNVVAHQRYAHREKRRDTLAVGILYTALCCTPTNCLERLPPFALHLLFES